MAAQKQSVQQFMITRVEGARRRLVQLEREVSAKGQKQQRELEALVKRFRSDQRFKALERRANKIGNELAKRFDWPKRIEWPKLNTRRWVEAVGVASQAQVEQLHRDLGRLAKKVEALASHKTAP